MIRILKFLAYAGALCVALALVLVLVASQLLDPNRYKDELAMAISRSLGREAVIEGPVTVEWLPMLAVQGGPLLVGNPAGFEGPRFLKVQSFSATVALRPLFSRRVEIDKVALRGLEVNLVTDATGRTNYDFSKSQAALDGTEKPLSSPAQPPIQGTSPGLALTLGGLETSDSAIRILDQRDGSAITLLALAAQSSAVEPGKPLDLELAFRLEAKDPDLTGPVQVTARLTFPGESEGDGGKIVLSGLTLKAELTGKDMPGGAGTLDLAADAALNEKTLDVSRLIVALSPRGRPPLRLSTKARYDLVADALKLTDLAGSLGAGQNAARFTGEATVASFLDDSPAKPRSASLRVVVQEFKPRELLASLNAPLHETRDPAAFSSASGEIRATWSKARREYGPFQLKIDQTNLKGRLWTPVAPQNSKNGGPGSSYGFDLQADVLNLDRYLPPDEKGDQIDKPEPKPNGRTSSNADANGKYNFWRALVAEGGLAVGDLTAYNLKFRDVSLRLNMREGRLGLNPIKAAAYDGGVQGTAQIDITRNKPEWKLETRITGVRAEPVIRDILPRTQVYPAGPADVTASLSGRGLDMASLLRGLSGAGRFEMKGGTIHGFGLGQADFKQGVKPNFFGSGKATPFTSMGGAFTAQRGLVHSPDFHFITRDYRLTGEGRADLGTRAFNFAGHIALPPLPRLPIALTGSFDRLEFDVLNAALITGMGGTVKDVLTLPLELGKDAVEGVFGGVRDLFRQERK